MATLADAVLGAPPQPPTPPAAKSQQQPQPRQLRLSRVHAAANVYVSEGRSAVALSELERAARQACTGGVELATVFVDRPYHRSSYTLVSTSAPALSAAAASLACRALELLDLRQHSAAHPRLGTVDHISCHPLTRPAEHMPLAVQLAHSIGRELAAGQQPVPVYFYGSAHPQGQGLAGIRRQLGYFSGSAAGACARVRVGEIAADARSTLLGAWQGLNGPARLHRGCREAAP